MRITYKTFTPPHSIFTLFLILIMAFGCSQIEDENTGEPAKCTLTYDSNGGSGEMKSTTGDEGTEITLAENAFTKTGYTFSEWNTKADGNGEKYPDKAKIKLTANTKLYAQWKANNYTVTFDKNANDATGDAPAEIQATYDVEFELPENTFTRTGYNFAGWNTKADGNGKDYEANTNAENLTAENNETVTLYAKWADRGTHKINYELNGGNHSGTPTTSFKETDEVTLGTAERTGYIFGGWYEAEDFRGTAVTNWKAGEKTEDVTLYANWTANNYTVKFDKNANDAIGNVTEQTFTYGISQALNENKFTRTGYDFAGWATSADGEVTYNDKQDYSIGTEDVTLYAKWKAIVYSITYNLDGGTNADGNPASYTIEDSITLKDPTKDGFKFLGWYENPLRNEYSKISKITKGTSLNQDLYAKWEAINYTIKYELDGGTNADGNPENYTIEDSITLKEPTKDSYTFDGWYESSNFSGTAVSGWNAGEKTENITLYAKWLVADKFIKVPGVSITGSEPWTPASEVFVSGHKLEIKAFWMSDHEVTRGEYKKIMGSDPSTAEAYDKDGNKLTGTAADNNPVNKVSWYDAIVYCNKRSIKEGLTPCYTIKGSNEKDSTNPDDWEEVPTESNNTWNAATCNFTANGYRLPTEVEWEWAARGGENYTYAGSDDIGEVAWYSDNTNDTGTRDVKKLKVNGYGLYDMSGNVWEWCWDWYGSISNSTPEAGASSGSFRCLRGGSWNYLDYYCEVASRGNDYPYYRNDYCGLRLVRTVE